VGLGCDGSLGIGLGSCFGRDRNGTQQNRQGKQKRSDQGRSDGCHTITSPRGNDQTSCRCRCGEPPDLRDTKGGTDVFAASNLQGESPKVKKSERKADASQPS